MSDRCHAGFVSPADISVIILAVDRPELLEICLAPLSGSAAIPGEVIVVSDGAAAEADAVAQQAPGVRLIRLPFSVGPASARNAGAMAAKGSVLLFLDADVQVRPETIGQIAEAMTSNTQAVAIIGSTDDSPAAETHVSQYRNLLDHFEQQNAAREAFAFRSACGAIRKGAFNAVGGFEAGHPLEDVELAYRLRLGGYRITMCPEIQVTSLKRWTLPSMIRADLFMHAAPRTRFLLGHLDVRATEINIGWRHHSSVLLAALTPLLLIDALFWRPAVSIALVTAALWLRLNAPFLRFLADRRGRAFAIAAIPLHWLHSVVKGLGLLLGVVQHIGDHLSRSEPASIMNPPLDSTEEPASEMRG